MGSIPASGRSPGRRYDNSLQYSCLENPMDRGAWQATVHRVRILVTLDFVVPRFHKMRYNFMNNDVDVAFLFWKDS